MNQKLIRALSKYREISMLVVSKEIPSNAVKPQISIVLIAMVNGQFKTVIQKIFYRKDVRYNIIDVVPLLSAFF